MGSVPIAWRSLPPLLLFEGGDAVHQTVVFDIRLPRFVLGVLAGAALGLSGALLQDAMHNPLADPSLLGLSGGASLFVAAALVFGLPLSGGLLPLYALAGGLVAGFLMLAVTHFARDPVQMILVGAALTALFVAAVTLMTVVGSQANTRSIFFYLAGSFVGLGWEVVGAIWPWLIVTIPAALLLARALTLLQLGDTVAAGLGLKAFRLRLLVFLTVIALVAPVTAHCGPIGFVALVSPHLARAAMGTSNSLPVMMLSTWIGALLLASADLLARTAASPIELPVGIVVTAFGAPLAILIMKRRVGPRAA